MFPHFPGVEMAVAFPPQKKKKNEEITGSHVPGNLCCWPFTANTYRCAEMMSWVFELFIFSYLGYTILIIFFTFPLCLSIASAGEKHPLDREINWE